MDPVTFQPIYTVLVFITFVALIIWAWSSKRKKSFDEAANIPLNDDVEDDVSPNSIKENHHV